MMPIGPLMIEHRLIDRFVSLMDIELRNISETRQPDIALLDATAGFFRDFVDPVHHGKEEDILFRDLGAKQLAEEHRLLMDELIAEHGIGRAGVAQLVEATNAHRDGRVDAVREVEATLRKLVDLYKAHIQKEDKRFFFPAMGYFSKQEQDAMIQKMCELDRKAMLDKYRNEAHTLQR